MKALQCCVGNETRCARREINICITQGFYTVHKTVFLQSFLLSFVTLLVISQLVSDYDGNFNESFLYKVHLSGALSQQYKGD